MNENSNQHGSNKSNSDILSQIQSDSEEFAKIFNSKLKQRILMTLLIYPELSLGQLSKKLGKVKSTISKHMKDLMDLGLVKRHERKYRSDKKQHIYSKVRKFGFRGKTYEDLKNSSPMELIAALKNEFIINLRLFTYISEVNQQVLEFINHFYLLKPEEINDSFIEDVYRYDTCVPRIKFMTREEYIDYREKFMEFDDKFITDMEQKRLENPIDVPKEYLTINEFIPIKQVMEFTIDKKKKQKLKKLGSRKS